MSFLFGSSEEREAKKREEAAKKEAELAQRQAEAAKREEQAAKDREVARKRDHEKYELQKKIGSLTSEKNAHVDQAGKILELLKPEIAAFAIANAPKWEYLADSDIDINDLDRRGELGWELINITSYETGFGGNITVHMRYVFKRPVPPEKDYPEIIHKKFAPASELLERVKELDLEIEELTHKMESI